LEHKAEMAEQAKKIRAAKVKEATTAALKRKYLQSEDLCFANAAFCEYCDKGLVGRYTMKPGTKSGKESSLLCFAICSGCYNAVGMLKSHQKRMLSLDISPCDMCKDHLFSEGYIIQKTINGKGSSTAETKESDSTGFDLTMSLHICADCKPTADAKIQSFATKCYPPAFVSKENELAFFRDHGIICEKGDFKTKGACKLTSTV